MQEINESNSSIAWSVFPNPSANGVVTVCFEHTNDVAGIQILNPVGEMVQAIPVNTQNQLELSIPAAGVYFVNVVDQNGELLATEKLIIQ